MKVSEIKVGRTYSNRGKGRTTRTVVEIGSRYEIQPIVTWMANSSPPKEPVVAYEQNGKRESLYISSFARWAGGVVNNEEGGR